MYNKAFDASRFLGYVNVVSPQKVGIHFPSAVLLPRFRHEGVVLAGGNVGEFVLIEGERYGFLAKITELQLPDSERKSLSEKAVHEENSIFHPIATAELLLSFSVIDPTKVERTISRFPEIGAKVYSCSSQVIQVFTTGIDNQSNRHGDAMPLGSLIASNVLFAPSLDAIFGRHCAVVGTTGSGKSWTVAKLLEMLISSTNNKIILLDPTGEYSSFDSMTSKVLSRQIGEDCFFPYEQLKVSDLFYLLRPTAQSQRPILMEAIRSLKTVRIAKSLSSNPLLAQMDGEGNLKKLGFEKKTLKNFQYLHEQSLDDGYCTFDINRLVKQIKCECVRSFDNVDKWEAEDARTYDFQSSLIFRIQELISTPEFECLFRFKNKNNEVESITSVINSFGDDNQHHLLRIDFSKTSSTFNAREIVANALAKYLYNISKTGRFKKSPIVIFLDEAHLFLNKSLIDADQSLLPLNAFDLIAKECRKFGVFLCLSTQMPRDIPVGTLSQMGTFIVHRLINEQDKKVIETACSSATRSALAYLPALGAGEVLFTGVDFPMSVMLKIQEPTIPPDSSTPRLLQK